MGPSWLEDNNSRRTYILSEGPTGKMIACFSTEREREKERKREREKGRKGEREKERKREREKERKRERGKERKGEREKERKREREKDIINLNVWFALQNKNHKRTNDTFLSQPLR